MTSCSKTHPNETAASRQSERFGLNEFSRGKKEYWTLHIAAGMAYIDNLIVSLCNGVIYQNTKSPALVH